MFLHGRTNSYFDSSSTSLNFVLESSWGFDKSASEYLFMIDCLAVLKLRFGEAEEKDFLSRSLSEFDDNS